MAYKGFSFRPTLAGPSGFPGDAASDTWADPTFAYVSVAGGGPGWGWITPPGAGNISAFAYGGGVDPRLWGTTAINGSGNLFRFDVPNGVYDIIMALGTTTTGTNTPNAKLRVGNGSTVGVDLFNLVGPSAQDRTFALDASLNWWSNATWAASAVPLRVTVTNGCIQLSKNTSFSNWKYIAYQLVTNPLVDLTFKDDGSSTNTPKIYEAEPTDKVAAYFSSSIGDATSVDYAIMEADGVTPNANLYLRTINGVLSIAYKSGRFAPAGPNYTFQIRQTEKVPGTYPNSPYLQSVTRAVEAAPTKPYNDGSLLAKISTGMFNARLNVTNKFTVPYGSANMFGEWPGYTGGTITSTTTVYSLSDLAAAISTYKASAALLSNTTYCIEIDSNGGSDWSNREYYGIGEAIWDFRPEAGNILLIRYKAGGNMPKLGGGWYLSIMRGVHVYGLCWITSNTSATSDNGSGVFSRHVGNAVQHYSPSGTRMSLVKFDHCLVGIMFDPANAALTPTTIDTTQCLGGFNAGTNGAAVEQFLVYDCLFWGVDVATGGFGARLTHMKNCDVAYSNADSYISHACDPTLATNCGWPDFNQYEWFENCSTRACADVVGAHADFHQQRTANYEGANLGTMFQLFEDCDYCYAGLAAGTQRNFIINSDDGSQVGVFLNNASAHIALRGIDAGFGVGRNYVEYNSLVPAPQMPAGVTGDQSIISADGSGNAVTLQRKNIFQGGLLVTSLEDNVRFNHSPGGGTNPNAVYVGPTFVDPSDSGRYIITPIADDPKTVTKAQFKANLRAALAPLNGVDAGIQPWTIAANGKLDISGSAHMSIGMAINF